MLKRIINRLRRRKIGPAFLKHVPESAEPASGRVITVVEVPKGKLPKTSDEVWTERFNKDDFTKDNT